MSLIRPLRSFVSALQVYFLARVGFQVSQVYLSTLHVAGPSLLLFSSPSSSDQSNKYLYQNSNRLDNFSNQSYRFHDPMIEIDYTSLKFHGEILKSVLLQSCESVIPLFSLATIIAVISKHMHRFMLSLMDIVDADSCSSAGFLSGILFTTMCLQCSLTSLPDEERYWRLLKIFAAIGLVGLEQLHKPVTRKLQSLSSSRSMSVSKHVRALAVGLFCLIFPIWFVTHLWIYTQLSTWKITVTIFSFEIAFKMSVTLISYAIEILDAFFDISWKLVDDHLFLLKDSCGVVSYLCAISLFINGVWILLFEHSTILRAFTLCIHFYFNLWYQACKGLKSLSKRHQAIEKVESLKDATQGELDNLSDVCCICFEGFEQAKVTRCNHFFHMNCLTRWLYLQDTCPMCLSSLFELSQPLSINR